MTADKLQMSDEMKINLAKLTPRERSYFSVMWPKSGVLYITAKPGVAKSAMARSIADKMGFAYQDIRLSMVDETDVGLYPCVSEVDVDGTPIKCLDFVVPRWAIEANKRPTIIHFEELNRASQQVRNAALQILLERQIGVDFRFNDTVLMMSSGNLGDEDGTDVEEFDGALNNRLVHYPHSLDYKEWIKEFADENIHPLVVSYILAHPEKLYQPPTENSKAYATPRSWTFLSDFITCNFGVNASPREFLPSLQPIASYYVGNSAVKFLQYCEDQLNISIQDVLDDYPRVEPELKRYNRDKKSELIVSLKQLDINKLNDKQLTNLTKFLQSVGEDELTAYLLYVVDNVTDVQSPRLKAFLLTFKPLLSKIKGINKPVSK